MAVKKYSVSISYPPLESDKGVPFLSQNRQFQWTNTGNVILPVIAAYGATALKNKGYHVFWDDAISEKISYSVWFNRLKKRHSDLIFIETKTPVIKKHWRIIKDIKKALPKTIVALMGDHVTALPEESLKSCPVDYVLTGGDFDFMMLNLASYLNENSQLEPGFYYRFGKKIKNTGPFALKHHHLDQMPLIDRELTKWKIYSQNNTNFKYKPGAYIMSGRDCWWGKCTFCSWVTTHPGHTFRTFSVDHTIKEIEYLLSLGIREIFDDSGTLPIGPWLQELCQELIKRGLNKKVVLGCNMRFGALNQEQYNLMAEAGFRFVLYGLESSNQKTLDKINKNTKVSDARKTLLMAKKAGLEPHITIMIGYPWETLQDAQNTLAEARKLFREGIVDSMQATMLIPYPGTALFSECQKNNLLLSTNWDDYDMRQAIMKSPLGTEQQQQIIRELFYGIITPKFVINRLKSIKNFADFKHLLNYTIKYFQKLSDFK